MASVRKRVARLARESKRYRDELRAFGHKVRSQRIATKWTLEQAAEAMEMDPTHLAKIEAGTINITFATLVRIAHGLGVGVADLFSND